MGRTREGENLAASAATVIAAIRAQTVRSLLYAYDGSTMSRMLVESSSNANLRVAQYYGSLEQVIQAGIADSQGSGNNAAYVIPYALIYNGSTWDRHRANTEITGLASAVRSATTNSSDLTNHNARGAIVFLDATAVPGGDTIQLVVQMKDAESGKYKDYVSATARAGTGTDIMVVYPGAGTATGDITDVSGQPMTRTFRVRVVHSAGSNFTYSVGVSLIV